MADLDRLDARLGAMQRRIWHALHSASDQEIRDGMDFYLGAYGLCRLISAAHSTTIQAAAGVYAALSPMNGWYPNVANTFDVFRRRDQSTVNTSRANHRKALRIAAGEDPLAVLGGLKVRSFYRAIVDPDDTSPIPVDRHLFCLALGVKIGSNVKLRSVLGSSALYAKVESVYRYLGEREGVGNRLASIAWFVQRRITSSQLPIVMAGDLVCTDCNVLMLSHGRPTGESVEGPRGARRRFRCPSCGRTQTQGQPARRRTPSGASSAPVEYLVPLVPLVPAPDSPLALGAPAWTLTTTPNGDWPAYPVHTDSRNGRRRVHCGVHHPYAYRRAGWQWLSRFLVMEAIGRRLLSSEHVDHVDRDKRNDRLENYRVLLAESHGRRHCGVHGSEPSYSAVIAEWSKVEGRFIEYEEPLT